MTPLPTPQLGIPLRRDQNFDKAHNEWLEQRSNNQINAIKSYYERYFERGIGHEVDLVLTDKHAHFILYEMPEIMEDIHHLSENFRRKLLAEGYLSYQSDVREVPHPQAAQHQVERHYLKPAYVNVNGRYEFPVLFGNIALEVFVADAEPYLFKLTCTYYSERNRPADRSLHSLMEVLLG